MPGLAPFRTDGTLPPEDGHLPSQGVPSAPRLTTGRTRSRTRRSVPASMYGDGAPTGAARWMGSDTLEPGMIRLPGDKTLAREPHRQHSTTYGADFSHRCPRSLQISPVTRTLFRSDQSGRRS